VHIENIVVTFPKYSTIKNPPPTCDYHEDEDEEVYGTLCGLYEYCMCYYPSDAYGKRSWLLLKLK
jgi:hypothetical protein